MLSKTDIANLAFGYLGSSLAVTDLTSDNSQQAKIARRHFRISLRTVLEKHEWGFAKAYSALNLVLECPDSGFGFAYSTPANSLVIRQVAHRDSFIIREEQYEEDKILFQEVGAEIHTDIKEAYAEYTIDLPEDFSFPSYFGRGVAGQMSLEMGPSVVTNNFAKLQSTYNF